MGSICAASFEIFGQILLSTEKVALKAICAGWLLSWMSAQAGKGKGHQSQREFVESQSGNCQKYFDVEYSDMCKSMYTIWLILDQKS